jgi:DNA-binding MarR family transcriptional regulator
MGQFKLVSVKKGFAMPTQKTLSQARYILETGRRMHDFVTRIHQDHLNANRKRRYQNLSVAQLQTIMKVRENGPVSITRLAELMAVSAPSTSVMVERLVAKGLLTRKPCAKDRRKVNIGIKPDVLADIESIEQQVYAAFVELVQKIGPETARTWCEILERVRTEIDCNREQGNQHG